MDTGVNCKIRLTTKFRELFQISKTILEPFFSRVNCKIRLSVKFRKLFQRLKTIFLLMFRGTSCMKSFPSFTTSLVKNNEKRNKNFSDQFDLDLCSEAEFKEFKPSRWAAKTGSNGVPAQISKHWIQFYVWAASQIWGAAQILKNLALSLFWRSIWKV